ncbi:MAG: HisA/HisF-related TIM barrel protein [Gammaproteobacteria bacterium]
MLLVPVIDIKNGVAVHAVQGQRDDYRPLVSRFSDSIDPCVLIDALCAALPARTFYVADLDAIVDRSPNVEVIARMADSHRDATFLIDGGFSSSSPPTDYLVCDNIHVILASEMLTTLTELAALGDAVPPSRTLLSLDRKAGEKLGCVELFDTPWVWPERVIHMNLSRVGSHAGPDFEGLATLIALAGSARRVYAAGGVRDYGDLEKLRGLGVAGVLVGSALHDGRLDAADLAAFY